jgi:hypothetical protein
VSVSWAETNIGLAEISIAHTIHDNTKGITHFPARHKAD